MARYDSDFEMEITECLDEAVEIVSRYESDDSEGSAWDISVIIDNVVVEDSAYGVDDRRLEEPENASEIYEKWKPLQLKIANRVKEKREERQAEIERQEKIEENRRKANERRSRKAAYNRLKKEFE